MSVSQPLVERGDGDVGLGFLGGAPSNNFYDGSPGSNPTPIAPADDPLTVPAAQVGANRETWVQQWSGLFR